MDKQHEVERAFLSETLTDNYVVTYPNLFCELNFGYSINWVYVDNGEVVGYFRAIPFPLYQFTVTHIVGKTTAYMRRLFLTFVEWVKENCTEYTAIIGEIHKKNKVIIHLMDRLIQRYGEEKSCLVEIDGLDNLLLHWEL